MEQRNKDFILDIRDRMLTSNIKDACLNYMKTHPQMFSDAISGDNKVMSITLSVSMVCKEEEIPTDPGFITISVDKDNTYSEHFESHRKYWNNEEEESDEQDM